MLFNSIQFLFFLIPTYFLFWSIKSLRIQNFFLLIVSYIFYSYWDWRFLFLLLFSTFLDYYLALKIEKEEKKKIWLILSITANLTFLGFFKYFNFFILSFKNLLLSFGLESNLHTLNIILPVGISFYTFHGLSYILDVYKGKIKAERNIVDYSLFVCYFPLLVAGPIERTTHLLPQIKVKKIFNYSSTILGLKQILWGCFKKVVIANQCAVIVDFVYENNSTLHGLTLFLAAVMFSIQIYCDFSGYTDMALGISRLFGMELLQNFHFPYFSKSVKEFWSKWHISLSTWFRDYVYIPLGGNRTSKFFKFRNLMVTFLLSGFWHGANWTFLVWGSIHGLLSYFSLKETTTKSKLLLTTTSIFKTVKTFLIVTIAWVFFRANSLSEALYFLKGILIKSLTRNSLIEFKSFFLDYKLLIFLIVLFFIVEFFSRNKVFGLQTFDKFPKFSRYLIYYFIVFLISIYSSDNNQFIYFQF